MSTTFLLTGASGFIALHVLNALLSKGYKVIGTVRSQSKADKLTSQFKKIYPNGELEFEIVEDISIKGSFDQVLQNHPEITEVIHTASPFSFDLNKPLEEAYLIPATQGTKNILESTKNFAPQVKNFIQTSSFAAIANRGTPGHLHTEESWNPLEWKDVQNQYQAYTASKKLSEKLAREFVEKEKPKFILTTVNPPYVLGPQLFEDSLSNPTLNTSNELINKLLKTPKDDITENKTFGAAIAVDVRDVAALHVLPLEKQEAAGKRFFPVSGTISAQYVLNLIHEDFPELNGVVGKGDPTFGSEEQAIKDSGVIYDNSKSLEWSGFKNWIPIEKTIKDSVQQILDYNSKK